ncbi:helix-turn-helix transcriptional regulator [Streptomyces sp. NBC_00366]|uniref:helix-turn-helix transcriptional regulator n=1 Tax=Streptomyces sp. NBC_00366 TaxID=2975727 RepID=UPI002E267A41
MPRTPNTRLRHLMEEADWSPAQLAAAVKVVAAEHGQQLACDRSTVSRWLSGTTPRPPVPAFLLEALARRLGKPITAYDAGLTSAPARTAMSDLSWEADPLRKLAILTSTDTGPSRRHHLAAGVFTLTALAVPEAADLARPKAATRHGPSSSTGRNGRVGRAEVDHMQTMARLFAQAAEDHGAGHVQPVLNYYLSHSVTGWVHAPATDTIHRQLLTQASQLTTLLGLMGADCGADALAQHCYRTAAHLAADADDMTAFAIALRALSAHAHELGHHTPAVHHVAERAADATRHAPAAVRAYTHTHLAVTRAHHDRYAALNTLTIAERLHDKTHATPGPFTTYSTGALHYQRAQILTTLGDHREAVQALTASLRHRTPDERRATTLTRARLAETLLAQGHLDAATVHWQAFLDTYPLLHSARATRHLDTMRQLLRPHSRHHTAAHLLTQATDLHP